MAAPYALELRDLAPPNTARDLELAGMLNPGVDTTVWRYTNVQEPAAAYADAAPGTPMALLAPFRVVKTVPEAVEYLGEVLEPLQLLGLLLHYFPEEYQAAVEMDQQMFVKGRQTYSPAECRLLVKIDEQLFPLPSGFMEYEWMEERHEFIPFQDHGVDWWDTDFLDFRIGVRFLIMLGGFSRLDPDEATVDDYLEETMEGEKVAGIEREIVDGINVLPPLDMQIFAALVELETNTPAPLRYLRQTMEIIDHSTGNIWFDAHEGNIPVYLRWSRQNIDMLAREWAEAKVMEERMFELVEWLEKDPENMREALAHYEDAVGAAMLDEQDAEDREDDRDDRD